MGRNRIKPTLNKGVAKVPVIMQLEALECGAAALAMVVAYYGKWIPLEQVRSDCGVSRNGANAKNIYLAAESYGFDVKAYRKSPENLKKEGRFPCIIHWGMNHFVVLNGFKGKWVYINDPAKGTVKLSWEEFDSAFTGIVIIPVPNESFVPDGKPRSTLSFARKRLAGAGAAIVFTILTMMLSYMFGMVNSLTARIFVDRILSGINRGWLYPFTGILVLLALVQIIVAWVQAIYSFRLSGKMAAVGSSSYMWKVLRLPMFFFSQRLSGDIQARLSLNAEISDILVKNYAPIALNSVMMVVYLGFMLRESPLLTLVGVVTVILNISVSRIISKKRMSLARLVLRDKGKLQTTTVSGISMMESIKAGGAEEGFFQRWSGLEAAVNSHDENGLKIDQYLGAVPALLSTFANYIVLVLGVLLTMEGKFTLGSVLMFQGFLNSFMEPVSMLINSGETLYEMRSQMERIEDVMGYPEDPIFNEESDGDTDYSKLKGQVELRNVTFGYCKFTDPLIKDFSISVKPGERIAIVGASGSGKSTVSKLISGLYQPWEGGIFFDGKLRSRINRDIMTGSLAVVDQDIILFEDSIKNNIKMWDNSIMDFEVILAARDAQIHDDIMQMSGGYDHMLSVGGHELSGGQRQRMEIARVLALDPSIIILDEATSALDAQTEYKVIQSIKDRGITCIVIAHRLSAVRDCDEIIVLEHGSIAERGTHDELMAKNGVYAGLVACE